MENVEKQSPAQAWEEFESLVKLNRHLYPTQSEFKRLAKEFYKEKEFDEMAGTEMWYYIECKAELELIFGDKEFEEKKKETIKELQGLIDHLAQERDKKLLDVPF